MDPGRGERAVPGALLSHLVPAAAARTKTPAASPLTSSQDILLAGCAAQARQKESPLRRCSLAFPRAGIQESLPTDWACRGPPRLCPHARFALSLSGRLPAELGWALRTQGGVRPVGRAAPCPHRAPEPGRSFWLSLFPLVPTGASWPRQVKGSRGCIVGVSVLQIFWPASREQVEHCQLAGKNVEVSRAGSPRLSAFCGLPWILNTHITSKGSVGSALDEGVEPDGAKLSQGRIWSGLPHPKQTRHRAGHKRPDLGSAH